MEKKTPKLFFIWSTLVIVVGIVAIRYYYMSSTKSFAILGVALLGIGLISFVSTTIYALHTKGNKLLLRLFSSASASLFLGFSLLFVRRYELTQLSYNEQLPTFANIAQPIGGILFLAGLLLILIICSLIKKRRIF